MRKERAIISLQTEAGTAQKIAEVLMSYEVVEWVTHMSGRYNLMAMVALSSMMDYLDFETQLVRENPEIKEITVDVVLQKYEKKQATKKAYLNNSVK